MTQRFEAGAPGEGNPRVFLFLQGPSSPLFRKLAGHLEDAGHICLHISLNLGDWIFWRRRNGYNFRGRPANWPLFVAGFLRKHGVTDLLLLGEERPYHRAATAAAKALSIDVYVVEMGYLRPDWVTFERDGMSSNSHFPRDPDRILAAARDLPEPDWQQRYRQSFLSDAGYDLLYNLPNVFFWFLYPFYQRHALFHPLAEYYGWTLRLLRARCRAAHATETISRLIASGQLYFVYPLQLQTDYQLRAHSDFDGQQQAIDWVITSFARHAAAAARLVIKVHPLDNGLIDWKAIISNQSAANAVAERVEFIDGGDLEALYRRARGVVTVNSTAALPALRLAIPVKVLGRAIYDIKGITAADDLDAFWTAKISVGKALVAAFFRLLANRYQVRGNFYSQTGAEAAAKDIAHRLTCEPNWFER